jgi:hypothetical protein
MIDVDDTGKSRVVVHDPPSRCITMHKDHDSVIAFPKAFRDVTVVVFRTLILVSARPAAFICPVHV